MWQKPTYTELDVPDGQDNQEQRFHSILKDEHMMVRNIQRLTGKKLNPVLA